MAKPPRAITTDNAADFWDDRYRGKSGAGYGSRGDLREFKYRTVKALVKELQVESVIDYGCGDGDQLAVLKVPSYIGLDISPVAIEKAKAYEKAGRQYYALPVDYDAFRADMTISLDVIMHLPDGDYEEYMSALFNMATRYVLIYAPNIEPPEGKVYPHMFFRRFTEWVEEERGLQPVRYIPNRYPATETANAYTSYSEFFLYEL